MFRSILLSRKTRLVADDDELCCDLENNYYLIVHPGGERETIRSDPPRNELFVAPPYGPVVLLGVSSSFPFPSLHPSSIPTPREGWPRCLENEDDDEGEDTAITTTITTTTTAAHNRIQINPLTLVSCLSLSVFLLLVTVIM